MRGSAWSMAKIASALMVGVLALGLYQLSESYDFFVYEADIRGSQLLSAEEIYAISDVHQHSIFWLRPREIAARLEAHPYVKQAVVRCRLPGEVRIEVTERTPRILWLSDKGERWVDAEGSALPPLTSDRLPLVLVDEDGQAGQDDGTLQADIAEGILLVSGLMPEVSQFRYDRTWGLLFQSPNGWHVALGDADHMPLKVRALHTIQEEVLSRGEQLQLIDLRYPNTPYYR